MNTNYYPFGMLMPGRNSDSTYRFGFNGKENLDDVKWKGQIQDYGLRIYDPRLGKFLSVDPMRESFPFYSPYHYASNSPICSIDLDGAEGLVATGMNDHGMVITKDDAAAINKRVIVNAFKTGFSESLPKKFIEHYAYGQGKPIVLNQTEMTQVHTEPVGLYNGLISQQVNAQISGMLPGESRAISFRAEDATAGVSGTLGQFTIIGEGTFTKGEGDEWSFSGTMQFYDVWDFNVETPQQETDRLEKTGNQRSTSGKEQTEFAHDNLPGKGFKITSDRINIKQTNKDKFFDWFKSKPTNSVPNRDTKTKKETKL